MINTEIWEPHPDREGFSRYKEQGKMRDIERDIKHSLDRIFVNEDGMGFSETTALQVLYWIRCNQSKHNERWPEKTEPALTIVAGNEGFLIEVLAMQRQGRKCLRMFTMKFEGLDHDETWRLACQLYNYFE